MLIIKLVNSCFIHISSDPLKSIENWFSNYELIDAAGGLVENNGNFLWIFRNGIWDLPKGKLEINENFQICWHKRSSGRMWIGLKFKNIKIIIYFFSHTYSLGSKMF